ncbi:MAG: Hsp20/alpha crystallin family protein [Haloferacaceae archaeon]
MNQQHQIGGDGALVRRYDDGDLWTVAADLGVGDDAVDVDTVGETAIVVVETAAGVHESELDLPGEAEGVTVNNGVLAITGAT